MKKLQLGQRDRRALLIGALALLPGLAFRFGVQPYLKTLQQVRAELRQEQQLLAREQAIAGQADRYPQRLRQARSAYHAEASRLLENDDPLMAASRFQAYLEDVAGEAGYVIQQAEMPSPQGLPGGLTLIRVKLRGSSDFRGLLQMLRVLQNGSRLVRVDALTVEAADAAQAPVPGSPLQARAPLTSELSLSTLMSPPETGPLPRQGRGQSVASSTAAGGQTGGAAP